jgi:hypothetical protein
MTPELAESLIAEYGDGRAAARAIQPKCRGGEGEIPSVNAIYLWINRASRGELKGQKSLIDPAKEDKLNQIRNALDEANIPIESIGSISHVRVRSGYHEGLTKDEDGNPVVTHLRSKHVSVMLSPAWEKGPEWPLIQPAKPVIIKNPTRASRAKETALKTIVVLSDIQVGFLRPVDDPASLVPMHDPAAIDVALQIVQDLQPDQIGYVGDFLDLPEMSRWLQHEEFWRTTQPAIDEGYKILAQFEAAAGPRENREPTQFLAGNHDRRLREYVVKNARAAYHLRRAQETPETWPDLTIPRLLRFDDFGIEYVGEYPGGEWWVTPKLVVRHNPTGKHDYDASVIAGHSHHIGRESFTRRGPQGSSTNTLWEIGCLCSLENYADRRSLLATRVPSDRGFVKNWCQGFAVVYVDKEENFTVDQVEIHGGRAIYRGRQYQSTIGA